MNSPTSSSHAPWPDRPLGGGEKLFTDEADILAIRRRVDQHPWAANLYAAFASDALADDAEYRRRNDGRPRNPYFVQSTWTRDAALYYRLSGDDARVPDVLADLSGFFGLDRLDQPLFSDADPPSWGNCGFLLIPRLAAYDLLRQHPLVRPLAGAFDARFEQLRHAVAQAMANWSKGTGALYNTTTWIIAGLSTVGFLTGDEHAIAASVDQRPNCFKAYFEGFRDRLFWPEPLDYAMGYTLSCLLVIAELHRKHGREDLYAYADPVTGASLRTFLDGALTQCFPDGRLATAGDESQQASIVAPSQCGRGGFLEDVYLFNDRSPIGRYKLDILHAAYGDPTFAWLIAQAPARDGYDTCFWGPVALTHGRPLEPQTPPPAPSGIYPGVGTAILRADESPAYWNSDAATVFLRSGRFYHSHVHFDPFSLVLNAFKKNLFPDWFIPWDYLAPLAHNGFANKCPFSRGPMGHNTVAVDRQAFLIDWYNHFAFRPDMAFHRLASPGGQALQLVAIEGEFFHGVRQKRTVALADRYVLDVFDCSSDTEHTYDYCLHSFGRLDLAGLPDLAPYDGFSADYNLPPIDSRSTAPDNLWLRPGLRSAAPGPFAATFLDSDSLGARSLFLPDPAGVPSEVFSTDTPYYVSPAGYDDLPSDGRHRRMPLLILRRVAPRATFLALHQPFRTHPLPLSLTASGSCLTVAGPGFLDTLDLASLTYLRRATTE